MNSPLNGHVLFQGQSKKTLPGNAIGHKSMVTLPPPNRIFGQITKVPFCAEVIALEAQKGMQLCHIWSLVAKTQRAGS
jgi:hypothetical protein